jgi:hypothetical protein
MSHVLTTAFDPRTRVIWSTWADVIALTTCRAAITRKVPHGDDAQDDGVGVFLLTHHPPPPLLWIVTVIPKPRKPLSLFAQLGRHFFSGRFPFSTVLSLICVVFGCTRCFPSGICDWSLFLANVTGKRKPKKNVSNTLYSLCLTGDFVTQSASSRLRTKHQDMILKTEKRSQLIWISFANCDQSQTTYLQSSVNSNPYTLNHGLLTPNPRL